MILSNIDIITSVKKRQIQIVPFSKDYVYPASYAFHVDEKLLRPIGNDLIDFRKGLLPEYEEITMTQEHGYVLQPGEFILGQTHEKLTLSDSLAMVIEGRSSLARVGLEIVQTSTFVEPNHTDSIITLELKNNGKSPFLLYPGMKIAKGIFYRLESSSVPDYNQGTYITQDEVEPPHIAEYRQLA
ncbi:dCTP deaminase [Candidatus Dojkabacteria bacterium]|uniref:dCTP deaminase n=1 Tax=Candidatus Dojkabacteria bacterium TaxID=2099670 RepID=A0A955L9J8_9BACT|nr:dCTP deaminase [Candidatus Dojkabacteria bacterium]